MRESFKHVLVRMHFINVSRLDLEEEEEESVRSIEQGVVVQFVEDNLELADYKINILIGLMASLLGGFFFRFVCHGGDR